MTIMASAPVPAGSRLVDADTIPAQRKAADNAGRWPMNTARPARPAAADFNDGYADALGRAVIADLDEQLLVEAFRANPAAVRRMADIVRAGEDGELAGEQVKDELEAFARQLGVFPAAPCPAWCVQDHHGEGMERLHSSAAARVSISHGVDLLDTLTITVAVDAFESPGLPGGIDPASIYLLAAADKDPDTQASGNLSPDQAETLAAALLAAAAIARQGSGPVGTAYRVDVFTADDVLLTSREVTAADDRAALAAAGGLVDELGGAVLAAVFTTGPAGALVYVDSVSR